MTLETATRKMSLMLISLVSKQKLRSETKTTRILKTTTSPPMKISILIKKTATSQKNMTVIPPQLIAMPTQMSLEVERKRKRRKRRRRKRNPDQQKLS